MDYFMLWQNRYTIVFELYGRQSSVSGIFNIHDTSVVWYTHVFIPTISLHCFMFLSLISDDDEIRTL